MNGRTIEWDDRYLVGIQLIDEQHKKLVKMTNDLYKGCVNGGEDADNCFKAAIHGTVDYIKYHSATEEQILENMRYPDFSVHKRQHDEFFREIFNKVQDFENGKALAPNTFVRYLRDWILTHIAFIDKKYATYLQILRNQNYAGAIPSGLKAGFHFLEKYLKPEFLPPPEIFWG